MQSTLSPANQLSYVDLSTEELINTIVHRKEGNLCANGAIAVYTGNRTGRSPKDRFIVRDSVTENTVAWNTINQPITPEIFDNLWNKVANYLEDKEHFIAHLSVGADKNYGVPVKVVNELAWQNLFVKNLFIRDANHENKEKAWTILSAPNFKANPAADGTNSEAAVILNFTKRQILVCGTHYAGEMKKAMFTVLNYQLPAMGVLPMHCSANVGKDGRSAVFFGLSGTGKTTLSADPELFLIGDDEHGWGDEGVFNFEGGCYAKCIHLSQEKEPLIWNAISKGAIMENVVVDPLTNNPDYDDDKFTQNTRAAYPLEHIKNRVLENKGGHPHAVIFLTCDLYGVLPPVSLLTKEQAAYHFLSGYTALVGSTEVGQTESIKPTFSTCFGAPFFPRNPSVYAELLMKKIVDTNAQVYLVNTGWSGGAYGEGGKRFDIPTTRAVISAILSGAIQKADCEILPGFELKIPKALPGVDAKCLNPINTWKHPENFKEKCNQLANQFIKNFEKFSVSNAILAAAPKVVD